MRLCLICCLVLILGAAGTAYARDDIYGHIMHGQWRQATDELKNSDNNPDNGDLLFFKALLEVNASRSAQLLQSSLQQKVDRKYQEEIYFRLAQYYLLVEDHAQVLTLTKEYQNRWGKGKFRAAMLRMAILAHEFADSTKAAQALNEQYVKEFHSGEAGDWGLVDRARILLGQRDATAGLALLDDRAEDHSEIVEPQALYFLSFAALERKDFESSMKYYRALNDRYPDAVGVDLLQKRLGARLATAPKAQPKGWLKAEEGHLPGYLTIAVGAFKSRNLAKEQAERLKEEHLDVDIEAQEIEGRTYYVTYIGHFTSREEAEHTKQRLENRYGEHYEVVIR